MVLESKFQANLIKRLKKLFPGCVVLKNDSSYLQGIPDLLILYGDKWAVLEDKSEEGAEHKQNQDYYISKLNAMSYAAFIFPSNEERIIYELQQAFRPCRRARVSKRL